MTSAPEMVDLEHSTRRDLAGADSDAERSPRGGIAIGWAGMAVSILLLVLSPLPRVRRPSDVPDVPV